MEYLSLFEYLLADLSSPVWSCCNKKERHTEQFCNKTVYIEVARRKKEKKRENNKENEEGK